MCIGDSVDIDPLPAPIDFDLFVLSLLYPTMCTMDVMLRMGMVSVINGGTLGVFSKFCLNEPKELLLRSFIGFAWYSFWFLVDEIKSAQEMT